ncbi:MAG: polyphosphate kinase 2 family protein [Planctomycetes bacterium]|nr:polyphosphate kinase 2 family protein [Planctomycetota bacterium]
MDQYWVEPGSKVDLGRWDPRDTSAVPDRKDEGKEELAELNGRLELLQELLYAEGKHKLLIVLQGMDTSGKDGTIRHVFDGTNPQGVRVASFKVPTPRELSHDYLWRVHQHTPERGEIVIFNRSHYGDVLVVRVLGLVPPEVSERRFDHINDFERMLTDEGVSILKFFLHISKKEQKARLQARLDEPKKRWKFSKSDLETRKLWDEYQRAYEEVLERTSTPWAPWMIVPADRKWVRNLLISRVLVEHLARLRMSYPLPEPGLEDVVFID